MSDQVDSFSLPVTESSPQTNNNDDDNIYQNTPQIKRREDRYQPFEGSYDETHPIIPERFSAPQPNPLKTLRTPSDECRFTPHQTEECDDKSTECPATGYLDPVGQYEEFCTPDMIQCYDTSANVKVAKKKLGILAKLSFRKNSAEVKGPPSKADLRPPPKPPRTSTEYFFDDDENEQSSVALSPLASVSSDTAPSCKVQVLPIAASPLARHRFIFDSPPPSPTKAPKPSLTSLSPATPKTPSSSGSAPNSRPASILYTKPELKPKPSITKPKPNSTTTNAHQNSRKPTSKTQRKDVQNPSTEPAGNQEPEATYENYGTIPKPKPLPKPLKGLKTPSQCTDAIEEPEETYPTFSEEARSPATSTSKLPKNQEPDSTYENYSTMPKPKPLLGLTKEPQHYDTVEEPEDTYPTFSRDARLPTTSGTSTSPLTNSGTQKGRKPKKKILQHQGSKSKAKDYKNNTPTEYTHTQEPENTYENFSTLPKPKPLRGLTKTPQHNDNIEEPEDTYHQMS